MKRQLPIANSSDARSEVSRVLLWYVVGLDCIVLGCRVGCRTATRSFCSDPHISLDIEPWYHLTRLCPSPIPASRALTAPPTLFDLLDSKRVGPPLTYAITSSCPHYRVPGTGVSRACSEGQVKRGHPRLCTIMTRVSLLSDL